MIILDVFILNMLIKILIWPLAFLIVGYKAAYDLCKIDKQIKEDCKKYKPHKTS